MRSTTLHVAVVVMLTGCSNDAVSPPSPADTGEADTGVAPDTSPTDTAPPCTQNGAAACNDYVGTYCARIVLCCNAGGTCNSACYGTGVDSCTVTNCKARSIKAGLDCSTPRFTSKTVCADVTKKCDDDIPLIPCSDIMGGTAGLPASCKTFLAQFPLF